MYWEPFAFIANDEIKNIAVFTPSGYTDATLTAKNIYGSDAIAVNVSQYPVAIGDKYINGEFRRYSSNGKYTVIEYIPTESENIQELKAASTKISDDITDVQLALAELYESGAALS